MGASDKGWGGLSKRGGGGRMGSKEHHEGEKMTRWELVGGWAIGLSQIPNVARIAMPDYFIYSFPNFENIIFFQISNSNQNRLIFAENHWKRQEKIS